MNNILISPFFRLKEFECRATLEVIIDSSHFFRLNALRAVIGIPFVVTSGFRSTRHNRAVGGRDDSLHLDGKATDILLKGFSFNQIKLEAEKLGFTEIGLTGDGVAVHLGG